ncbi:MAG: PepSY domain-containing protein [Allosphingosinicella sp.]|uniref:PepSY domain-containing protein n=1 Tax=Allosphingosinicella sp. TaxID=2823234 RepID=UPI00394550CD
MSSLLLRRIHKWIGLVIGIQLVLWTLSGAVMSMLNHETVAGGPAAAAPPAVLPSSSGWGEIQSQLAGHKVTALTLRPLLGRYLYALSTDRGSRLFDAESGRPIFVDAALAERVARAAYGSDARVGGVAPLAELELAVREHQLPIWRVDFADEANSSFYVSGTDGRLLERRSDTWRTWDFFWMLHNMDYANRTNFNHPLIVLVGFAALWLAVTGFWLLFRTAWKPDLRALRRRRFSTSAERGLR